MTNLANATDWCPEIGERMDVDVRRLALGVVSPRFPRADGSRGEERFIADLYKTENLTGLFQSISANGYMNIESLIVVLDEEREKLLVIEGNRRLAAILLFLDDGLLKRVEKAAGLKVSMPKIDDEVKESLQRVSVFRMKSREDAKGYIGFKHIHGSTKWKSYARARFVASWHTEEGMPLDEISRRIDVQDGVAKRMVAAVFALDQAEREGVYDISDRSFGAFDFFHLYAALSRYEYLEYLGIGKSWAGTEPSPNLVPKDKLDRLGEVLVWIFGSKQKDQEPVVRFLNPDIEKLGEVLGSSEACHALRACQDLDEAHRRAVSPSLALSTALANARMNLEVATTCVTGFDGRNRFLLDIAQDVCRDANEVYAHMKSANRNAMGDEHAG